MEKCTLSAQPWALEYRGCVPVCEIKFKLKYITLVLYCINFIPVLTDQQHKSQNILLLLRVPQNSKTC